MTRVINGNSYEFPSVDMHRTIINKLIMNDSELFKDFFLVQVCIVLIGSWRR
jgi:hypothetical protein